MQSHEVCASESKVEDGGGDGSQSGHWNAAREADTIGANCIFNKFQILRGELDSRLILQLVQVMIHVEIASESILDKITCIVK